ncbi:MAG TPA: hypothetical protein VFX92_12285, partial [Candidatus Krumholzibacteria bacterium]|nr:hypothetical protein [Candidatus Krumholzibacteria bacterium]
GKGPAEEPHPFQNMRFSTETSRGDVNDCILSPDGRYLAYVVAEQGQIGLFVRQVATGSDVPVIPLAKDRIEMPRFSPDGNYLFYLGRKPDAPLYRTLFRIASLGGTPEERAFDVDSRVSFSPDGKQFAFVRGFPQDGRTGIFVMDADGTNERELASVKSPEEIASGVEWSPDGKSIATLTVQPPPQSSSTLVLFDVKSGQRSDVTARKQAFYNGLAWMGDASAVVVTGNDLTMGFTRQAFLISVPGGQVRRVTNDFNQYDSPSVTASSDAIALIRGTYLANLWSVDPAGGANAQVTRATSSESSPWNFGTADGAVVYAALRDQALKLFVNPLPDGEPRVINTGPGHAIQIRSRARMVAFAKYNEGEQHLWCVGLDGSGLRQLTNFGGEDLLDISPDGRLVAFSRADSASGVWLVPTDGGEPRVVSRTAIKGVAAFSEDGNWLGYAEYDRSGGLIRTAYYKMTLATGEISPPLNAPPQAVILRWLPDQSGYCYSDRADPAGNIFRASFDGSEPVRMTDFKDMRITDFDFSPDGKQMAIVRWLGNTENVWVANADGSNPRQVTTFASQVIFGMRWMANPMRVIVTAGDAARDVVMIREFK